VLIWNIPTLYQYFKRILNHNLVQNEVGLRDDVDALQQSVGGALV
jgi:hypothetical protein